MYEAKNDNGYLYVFAIRCYVLAIGNEHLLYKGNKAIWLPASYHGGIGIDSEKAGFKLFTIQ